LNRRIAKFAGVLPNDNDRLSQIRLRGLSESICLRIKELWRYDSGKPFGSLATGTMVIEFSNILMES
jgi:hypothetical protein